MSGIAIGIDLGTTNSCASYYYNGRVRILENSDGGRITPSFLYFTEKNAIAVGHYAKRMAEARPEKGVYEIKRLIGRKVDDPLVQKSLQYFSFKVVGNDSNDPVIEIDKEITTVKKIPPDFRTVHFIEKIKRILSFKVDSNDSNHTVIKIDNRELTVKKTPQELCTAILAKIKKDVEAKLMQTIDKAVITVPAYFNMNQREVTLAAAKQAGFTVLKLLNEPTAAALSFYLENDRETENHALVYDLGGGTFDVAVLKRNLNNIEILSVDGDPHFGGQDLDNLILDYVNEQLKKKYNYDVKKDRRAIRRLQNICEEAKKTLSVPEAEETTITLTNFVKNHDVIEILLTRKDFEAMTDSYFKKSLEIVDSCLKSSNLTKSDIKEVILSGGSTRIPKIQSMLTDYFNGKNLNKFVNPDECVAEGAAIQAALFSDNPKQKIDEIRIIDVTPLSLGFKGLGNIMEVLINRNTPIPTIASKTTRTVCNKQESIAYSIYEGERLDVRKNRYLGTMVISDLTPAPPCECEVTLTMTLDLNGILNITAKEKIANNVKDLKIDYTRGQRSDSEVKNALKDAEDNKQEDNRFIVFAECKRYVLLYCIRAIYNFENKNLNEKLKDAYDLCKETQRKAENLEIEDEAELKLLKKELEDRCDSIVQEHNFEYMQKL